MRRLFRVVCGVVVLAPTVGHAQNADPYFFGDEAALSAGAVTASGRDAGSLWYNPAGLGGMKHTSVSASATTFGLRIRPVPEALRVRVGNEIRRSDQAGTDILSVPNSILFGGALTPRIGFAIALLTTQRDVRAALIANPEGPTTAEGQTLLVRDRLDLQSDAVEYHAGGALGFAITNRLRLGFSAFATYAKTTDTVQYALSLRGDDTDAPQSAFASIGSRVTRSTIGTAAGLGLQWHPTAQIAVGVSLRLPQLGLSSSASGGATEASGGSGEGVASASYRPVDVEAARSTGRALAPARVSLGVAYAAGRGSWLEAAIDATHGLPSTTAGPARRSTVNARFGARLVLSPQWVLGTGVFTDRALSRDLPVAVGGYRVDYYGFTLGLTKRTPLALAKNPDPEALVLVTTLSMRTAVGVGDARAALIDLAGAGAGDPRSAVTFWDLMPYFGSSVLF